jgi:hypothetical protein
MRRLFAYGLLIFGIYYIIKGGTGIIGDFGNSGAALVVQGITNEELHATILEHYKTAIVKTTELYADNIDTTVTDLNEDGQKDVIAVVESGMTCGGGGCIASIFIVNDVGELTPIPFSYAVKHIEVLDSITKGMHDLRINQDKTSRMVWDGVTYVLEQM